MADKKPAPKKKPAKKKEGTRRASLIGNQFWKIRTKHGRDKIFKDPSLLWEYACEYFKWCDANPWKRNEAVKAGDHFGEQVSAETSRPYTQSGLCVFLDIDEDTLDNYGKKEGYEDFFGIVRKIKRIIRTQKFEGAAVGAFNASIIARDLGLADKKEVTGKDGGPIQTINSEMSQEQAAEVYNEILG